jgi:cytochrome P450
VTARDDNNSLPVLDFKVHSPANPVISQFELFDNLRTRYPWFRSSAGRGFWVLTQYKTIAAVLQDADTFSSKSVYVLAPDLARKWIPVMTDPPEHTAWRRLLAPLFSPRAVAGMQDRITSLCIDLISSLASKGSCDFVADFARQFPTTVFLELMGLPVQELDRFLAWEAAIERPPDSAAQTEVIRNAMTELALYLSELIRKRRADPSDDLVSTALNWHMGEQRIDDEDLLSLFMQLFVAGLTTVPSELSYIFLHLATHDDHRARISADPSIIPQAVEEFLRIYPVVILGRKLARDSDLGGCPMKAGDMLMLPISAANRDPEVFPEPAKFSFDRSATNHLSFGAGRHNCIGAHLARQELRIALEQWHKLIPHYRLTDNAHVEEYRSQTLWVESLPLTWSA